MARIDPAKIWTLSYRVLVSVIASVGPAVSALGLETKELFILAELEEHPYPAELAARLSMPRPTVTVNVKRLEAAGFVSREIDPADLRRHRLRLTPAGRNVLAKGLALLSDAFGARLCRLTVAEQRTLGRAFERMS
jgi:DNA-binding MarR family transcriptional regulator